MTAVSALRAAAAVLRSQADQLDSQADLLDQTDERMLTVADTATQLGVHENTVLRMIDRAELVGAVRVGRQWRIPAAALRGLTP